MGRAGHDHQGFCQPLGAVIFQPADLTGQNISFGKVSVLAALLSCITWIPALIIVFCAKLSSQGGTAGSGKTSGWQGRLCSSCLIWIAMISLISMAVAVWVKWRIVPAQHSCLGIFFLLPAVAAILNVILRTQWGNIDQLQPHDDLSLDASLSPERHRLNCPRHSMPCHSGPHGLRCLQPCAACFWLLDRKLRAREVERS